jgi:hypothetical protein
MPSGSHHNSDWLLDAFGENFVMKPHRANKAYSCFMYSMVDSKKHQPSNHSSFGSWPRWAYCSYSQRPNNKAVLSILLLLSGPSRPRSCGLKVRKTRRFLKYELKSHTPRFRTYRPKTCGDFNKFIISNHWLFKIKPRTCLQRCWLHACESQHVTWGNPSPRLWATGPKSLI